MNNSMSGLWKKCLSVAALGLGLSLSSPVATPAAGLGDLLAGLNVTSGCTQFMGPFGYPVTVNYFLPGGNCAAPAVIVLHGIDGGTRYGREYHEIGRGLAAKGYAAFCVQYFEGQPNAVRPGPYDRGLPDPAAFVPWVQTVKSSVSFVQQFPGVDPNRVGIIGTSLGGFVGSSAAADDPRVRSLVVLSGGMPDPIAQNVRWLPRTLIVHGAQDQDVPVWEAYKFRDLMARRGLPHNLVVLPCEGHLPFRDKEGVAEKVLCFFDSTL
jgi:carboxymethylenebutenolidase